jgi:hypothetical protein
LGQDTARRRERPLNAEINLSSIEDSRALDVRDPILTWSLTTIFTLPVASLYAALEQEIGEAMNHNPRARTGRSFLPLRAL